MEHEPEHEPGHQRQQVLPILGISPPQPTNQETTGKIVGVVDGKQGAGRTKPRHGAKGRGMIWLDHGTPEWDLYAADFREKRGADKLPESRPGGRGNWFVLLGEPAQRRRAR